MMEYDRDVFTQKKTRKKEEKRERERERERKTKNECYLQKECWFLCSHDGADDTSWLTLLLLHWHQLGLLVGVDIARRRRGTGHQLGLGGSGGRMAFLGLDGRIHVGSGLMSRRTTASRDGGVSGRRRSPALDVDHLGLLLGRALARLHAASYGTSHGADHEPVNHRRSNPWPSPGVDDHHVVPSTVTMAHHFFLLKE